MHEEGHPCCRPWQWDPPRQSETMRRTGCAAQTTRQPRQTKHCSHRRSEREDDRCRRWDHRIRKEPPQRRGVHRDDQREQHRRRWGPPTRARRRVRWRASPSPRLPVACSRPPRPPPRAARGSSAPRSSRAPQRPDAPPRWAPAWPSQARHPSPLASSPVLLTRVPQSSGRWAFVRIRRTREEAQSSREPLRTGRDLRQREGQP